LLVVAVAAGAPGRVSSGWDEFKGGAGPGSGSGRLGSVAGQNRYQLWSAALDQNESKPLNGTGSGTFEYWWNRAGSNSETVRDSHSLYLQTLGELGIVGFALIAAFLVVLFVAGGQRLLAGSRSRPQVAAALAGLTAFCITAAFDWSWQMPVLAVATLLLGSVLLGGRDGEEGAAPPFALPARVALAFAALAAIVFIAIPLASTSLLRQSEADAREGDLDSALAAARSAQNVQPGTAGPRLQQALVLEELGRLDLAALAAAAASERESTNWRIWVVRSRIEAERGRAAAALRDYRVARSLNPRSSLFLR
jgi:hypothetical protein